jgi:hypothetical protein
MMPGMTTTAKASKTKSTKSASLKTGPKKTGEHLISKKRSGRYLVRTLKGKVINGMDKTRILVAAKLVQAGLPKTEGAPAATPAET